MDELSHSCPTLLKFKKHTSLVTLLILVLSACFIFLMVWCYSPSPRIPLWSATHCFLVISKMDSSNYLAANTLGSVIQYFQKSLFGVPSGKNQSLSEIWLMIYY
uniref:Uncharacterized protein n=1 Tax=Kalanchoe fedtschenkoi TaxID=63787 RepID=A0A7N0TXF6_KALFE